MNAETMGAALRHQDVSHMRRIKEMEAEHAHAVERLHELLSLALSSLDRGDSHQIELATQIRAAAAVLS